MPGRLGVNLNLIRHALVKHCNILIKSFAADAYLVQKPVNQPQLPDDKGNGKGDDSKEDANNTATLTCHGG